MEVRIGVQTAAREIVLESGQTPDQVAEAVEAAITAGGLLALEDDKGRRVLVPADRLAYVEIGPSASRRVGFGAA
ncbi:MAG: DUF3107 domain-containing protein [Actinomycetota bacterium]